MVRQNVIQHCKSNTHLRQAKLLRFQPKLQFAAQSQDDLKQTEADVPLAFHDCLSPTIRKVFPDSKIASTIWLQPKPLVCSMKLLHQRCQKTLKAWNFILFLFLFSFDSVEYFVLRYPEIFPDMGMDHLNQQFVNYQLQGKC